MELITDQAVGGATLSLADHDLLDDRDHRAPIWRRQRLVQVRLNDRR